MEYQNIDGTGWPDAVVVDNGGDIFEHAYETRTYFPVDRNALLSLADEMETWALTCDHYDRRVAPIEVSRYARRIREALGERS